MKGLLRTRLLLAIGLVSGVRVSADAIKRRVAAATREAQDASIVSEARPDRPSATPPSTPTAAELARKRLSERATMASNRIVVKAAATQDDPVPAFGTGHDTQMSRIHGPYGYLKELISRFSADQCGSWAASLSFFSILSLAPLLLCGLAVLGFLIKNPQQAADKVFSVVDQFVPDSKSASEIIQQMHIRESAQTIIAGRGIAGVIGILSLIWSALQIFVNALAPINAAFRAPESRNWFKQRWVAFELLLVTALLFLISMALPVLRESLNHLWFLRFSSFFQGVIAVALTLLSIIANASMFAVIYRYLPSPAAKATWKSATFAGGSVAVLFEAAKQAFGFYVVRFASTGYNKVYGSLGGLVALFFWIYYASMILLLGAEIAKLRQDYLDSR